MSEERLCESCGGPLPARTSGRVRRFCSDTCRSRASRARRSGSTRVPAVAAEAAVDHVLSSPVMSQKVIENLAERIASGALDGPEWNHLIAAILRAHHAVTARVTTTNHKPR